MTRKVCYGPDAKHATHVNGCRPGRPLCRFMRRVRVTRKPCHCDAYHFPHRNGSGLCGDVTARELMVHGPIKETG